MKNTQTHDYLERINLHNATEIETSPRPLKNTQMVRNNKILSKNNEYFRIIVNKRNIDGIVPIIVDIIPPIIKTLIYSLSTDSNIFSPRMIAYPHMDMNFFGGYQ